MPGLFDIDYNALVVQRLPVRWRNPVMIAWCRAQIAYIVQLKRAFDANRAANLYFLAHNGQVPLLTAALNDMFDNTLRRIYIGNPGWIQPVYFYQDDEITGANPPVYFYQDDEITGGTLPVYFYQDSEVVVSGDVSFVVWVPSGLAYNTAQMEALIDSLKKLGKLIV